VSLPTGAEICAAHTLVQFTIVGVPALPPDGATVIEADFVAAETYAGLRACADGDGEDAAAQLNTLLMQHPVHPQLSGHDEQPWHVHYTESGSVADKYAAGAVMGLAVRLSDVGLDRFGVCQAAGCRGVFIDTSTSNTRRYCSERCMNRANVSAFRARKRDEGDEESRPGAELA